MLQRIDRAVCRIEDMAIFVVAACVFLVMLIKFSDVVFRYALNQPIQWSYGFISHYLLVAAFFLALPYTFRTGRHVRVDAFVNHLPSRIRRPLRLIDLLVSLVLFGLILYQGIGLVSDAWNSVEVMPDFYNWPSWTSKIFVPVGIGLLEVRLLLNMISAVVRGVPDTEINAFVAGAGADEYRANTLVEPSGAEFQ